VRKLSCFLAVGTIFHACDRIFTLCAPQLSTIFVHFTPCSDAHLSHKSLTFLLPSPSTFCAGELIDNQLLAIVQDRMKTGQNVDDFVMREILVDLLTAVGKETMLRENGGERLIEFA
jgi:hypothetical protein